MAASLVAGLTLITSCSVKLSENNKNSDYNNTIYRGSDNQEIHFLSPRYRDFKDIIYNTHNRDLEFISRNGELFMIGIPEKGFEAKFKRAILERTNFFKEEEK